MDVKFIRMIATAGLLLAALLLPLSLVAADTSKLVIVLDASNSMWGQANGSHKITLARAGLETLLAQQPANASVGLVTYGNRHKSDCTDISTLASPGEQDMPSLLQHINGIAPYGRSPISAALEQAVNLLEGVGNILLVSDGPESCQGDPCATAKRLKAANPSVQIHVLSFEDTDTNSLRCLAENSGGQFALIGDANQLAQQLLPATAALQTADSAMATDSTPATLKLSAGASGGGEALMASYLIYTEQGDHVASLTARTEVDQPIPPGKYQIHMLWRTTKLEATLELAPGQTLSHHFDLGPMGKLRLEALDAQQQPLDANFTLYSPTGDYLAGHLLKSQVSDTLPVGIYRIKANVGDESQESQLEVTANTETAHTFQFRTTGQ